MERNPHPVRVDRDASKQRINQPFEIVIAIVVARA